MNETCKILFYVPFQEINLQEQDRNWLTNFKKAFSVGLKQIVNVNIEIDDKIYYEADLNEKLNKNIVIQLILNESLNLDYCLQNSSLKEKFENNRILQLICFPLVDETLKNAYKSFIFYDENTNKPIRFNESLEKIKDEVWLKLLDISFDIKRIVKNISEKTVSETQTKGVFLAFCSPDQNNNKLVIEREIRQLGYTIYDPSEYKYNTIRLNEYINDSLSKSVLSVHIIGNTEFPAIPNEDISVVEFQNRVFVNYINKSPKAEISRLVWIPPDLKPKSEKQKLYIDGFMHQVEAMEHTEIIQTPVELFKSIIQRKLKSKELVNIEAPKTEQGNRKSIYLIHKEIDSDKADKIKTFFKDKGIGVLINSSTISNIESIRLHQQNLIFCDAVMILYTDNNRFWLNSKISDILKAPGIGRKKKFVVKALLTETQSDLNALLYKDLMIVDNKTNLSISLQPIIEILEKYDISR